MPDHILIVEDEEGIVELIAYNLKKAGYSVKYVMDGIKALEFIESDIPLLILLDLMLPGINGNEICKILKSSDHTRNIPIIVLTAKTEEDSKILGFDLGIDDYVTKPFSIRELIARIKAVLNRVKLKPEELTFKKRDLFINFSTHEIRKGGHPIQLTPTEFRLLKLLIANRERVFSREQLLDKIWGSNIYIEPRTVDVHVSRLRSQIEDDPTNPSLILTIRGAGYKFTLNKQQEE